MKPALWSRESRRRARRRRSVMNIKQPLSNGLLHIHISAPDERLFESVLCGPRAGAGTGAPARGQGRGRRPGNWPGRGPTLGAPPVCRPGGFPEALESG